MSVATGLPEIVTAVFSSLGNVAGLSAGNLFGASLINMTLILGLSIIAAGTLTFNAEEESFLLKLLLIVTAVASIILLTEHLYWWHGVALLVTYGVTVYTLRSTSLLRKIMQEEVKESEEELKEEPVLTGLVGTSAKLVGSLSLVSLGAHITVESTVILAETIGASVEVIGSTVVALGTTLPELTLELNAVKRREYALALGDIFGSTLVNLSLVLGILSLASQDVIHVAPLLNTLLFFVVSIGAVLYFIRTYHEFRTYHGVMLVVLCVAFFAVEIALV
jgi:cation:H+ antiporter